MRIIAKYKNMATGETYHRTIDANDDAEAQKLAKRLIRKGYILIRTQRVFNAGD